MHLVAQHGRLGQPGFEQVAAAQAGRFALRGNADFDVEMVALLDARPQNALQQDQRHVAGGQHGVGIGHAAGLHLFQQGGPLRRRAGIAARAVQAGHQPDGLDPHGVHAGRHGQVADQPGVAIPRRLGLVGALRPHGQPVQPRTSPKKQRHNSQSNGKTFHASLHSASKVFEFATRKVCTGILAGQLGSHSDANDSDLDDWVKRKGERTHLEKWGGQEISASTPVVWRGALPRLSSIVVWPRLQWKERTICVAGHSR